MNQLRVKLAAQWEENPLRLVMALAIFLRLISVLFAKGWGMLDDHFLVIEVSQSWADGLDVKKWLPWTPGNHGPEGHSFLYVGIHFLIFSLFKFLGITDPQGKMYLIRAIHAAFSLITVYYGYKITLRLSDKKSAGQVGLLLAAYWFMPWTSVRNLVEIVAIPLLISGTWMVMTAADSKRPRLRFLLAGVVIGFAFSVRYQTGIFTAGTGLVLLLQKQIKPLVFFAIGNIMAIFAIQGCVDIAIWGRPFAEMGEYIQYNLDNRYKFYNGDWYNYLLLLGGILIPPVSLFLMAGMFKSIRRNLIIFLPVMLFLAFHSYFPNKQERFILTIVPFIVIIGIVGWNRIVSESAWWGRHQKLLRNCWIFFWIVNAIVLVPISTMYGKRSRAEAMTYLRRYDNIRTIMVENTNAWKVDIVPQFYAGQMISCIDVTQEHPLEEDTSILRTVGTTPRFVLFMTDVNLDKRLQAMKKYYPELVFETKCEPGFLDQVMHTLNPKNTSQTIYIYRNTKYFPVKK